MEPTTDDAVTEFGDPSYPDLPTEPGHYSVRALWRITEMKDGAVFRTTFVRHYWEVIGSSEAPIKAHGEVFLVNSVSDKYVKRWLEAGKPVFKSVRG